MGKLKAMCFVFVSCELCEFECKKWCRCQCRYRSNALGSERVNIYSAGLGIGFSLLRAFLAMHYRPAAALEQVFLSCGNGMGIECEFVVVFMYVLRQNSTLLLFPSSFFIEN